MSWWDEFSKTWGKRDGEALASWFTENAIYVGGSGRRLEGAAMIGQYIRDYTEKFSSDYVVETVSFFQAGDRFAAEWIWRGTNDRGGLMGPATGRPYTIHGVSTGRLGNGKIEEARDYWDTAGFLRGLGLLPTPGSSSD